MYAMPTLHNPLGWVMSAAHRNEMVEIARRHNLLIIEDAAYAFLVDEPPPPLATLAPERTFYVSGISKSVATGLRMGFIASPVKEVPALERIIRATTWNTPGLVTAIASTWLDDGTVARLEVQKRLDAQSRQIIAAQALAGLSYISHPSSYFIWLPIQDDARADRITMALLREQVAVSTAEPFAVSACVPHALRLALGSVNMKILHEALAKVKWAVEAQS